MGECAMRLLWLIVVFVMSSGCKQDESSVAAHNASVELALRAPVQKAITNSAVKFSKECMVNLGLCWYRIGRSANEKDLPSVTIKSADSTLGFQNVTDVTLVVDDQVGKDIENIDVALRGLPDNSTHEQNRDFIYKLIENIKSSGWKHYYSPGDPRISGSNSSKIDSPGKVLGHYVSSHPWFDPDYVIDMNRWRKVSSFYSWCFYSQGDYLTLKAWRRNSSDDPATRGTYLITMEFKTEREFWLSEFSGNKDRANWKELLPARLSKYKDSRRFIEDEARASGMKIDESYQDPPIQALSK